MNHSVLIISFRHISPFFFQTNSLFFPCHPFLTSISFILSSNFNLRLSSKVLPFLRVEKFWEQNKLYHLASCFAKFGPYNIMRKKKKPPSIQLLLIDTFVFDLLYWIIRRWNRWQDGQSSKSERKFYAFS